MPWKSVPKQRGGRYPTNPFISIQKSGAIFPSSLVRDWLKQPEYLEILIDEEKRLLGLRATDDKAAYHVVYSKSNAIHIAGSNAIRRLGIELDKTHRATATLDADSGIAYICVDDLRPIK